MEVEEKASIQRKNLKTKIKRDNYIIRFIIIHVSASVPVPSYLYLIYIINPNHLLLLVELVFTIKVFL